MEASTPASEAARKCKNMFIHWFQQGGPIMWPILILSIVTLGAVLERVFFLWREFGRRRTTDVNKMFQLVEHGNMDEALELGKQSEERIAMVLTEGLSHRATSYTDAMMEAANTELERYTRGLVILDTAVTLGPLLGLLGTVVGMMSAFGLVGGDSLAGKTQAITGGVAESLIAVSFGLGVAIIAILPLNYLNARLEKVRRQMESAMTRMELQLKSEFIVSGGK
jgi:biopolymer transport protein ExbB